MDQLAARVLGNSNSLMRGGYTEAFRVAFKNIDNYSFGSSSVALLGLRAEAATRSTGGFIVIDTAVIDALSTNYISLDEIMHAKIYETFICHCAQQKILPIILIMPSSWYSARGAQIHRLLLSYSHRFGVPVFDGFAFLERLMAVCPSFDPRARVLSAHLEHSAARVLGSCLVEAISRFRQDVKPQRQSVQDARRFVTTDLYPLVAPEKRIARSTSLAGRTVVALAPGDMLDCPTPLDGELIGLSANSSACTTGLAIETGSDRVFKDLRNARTQASGEPRNELVLNVWKLRRPLTCRDGHVRLRCISASELEAAPYYVHNETGGARPLNGRSAELDTLIFMVPSAEGYRDSYVERTDLLALLSDSDIQRFAGAEPEPGISVAGRDGVLVKIPAGLSWREGSDGRVVPLKPGQYSREDETGRVVLDPPPQPPKPVERRSSHEPALGTGLSWRVGADGHRVEIPAGHLYRQGPDGRIVTFERGQMVRAGKDGRMVAVPAGWTFRQGDDGRIVPIPPGATFRQNNEGRIYQMPVKA